MTSTDSSNSQNQNNSTSETPVETSHSKAMNTTANNDSQVATVNDSVDISNMSSSEASSSPSSSSPASSSPTTSSNNTSADKAQGKTATETDDNKPSESEQPVSTNSTNKPSQKSNNSKKNHSNQKHNSIDHSPIVVPPSQLPHQPFINYYQPYVPRASGPNSLPPYTQQQQFEANGSQGPWLPHAMAAMSSDPMAMAAYMNNGQQNGAQYPTDQQHYEQFNFGFTPAFGFGYAGTGSIDYMSIQQAAQQGRSNLNPQSTQWTPSSTATTTAATGTTTNPTSSPANTTTSSNDTTSSVPSTSASETSASNVKWMQVTQDPSAVLEFNAFPQQQLSPVDMYTPHHNNANSYRSHYNRHNQMQANYHHYQYQNPYQHYPSQYNMHPMHGNGSHHYNSHKYNKYNNNNNNYYTDNTGNSNYHTHDNNNNSKKSNNLNNTDSAMTMVNSKQVEALENPTSTETKSESGSKSWASIVGVSGSTSNTPPSTQQTSNGSSPAPVEITQEPQQPHVQQQQYQKKFNQYNNHGYNGEYTNMRPRNNYQKSYNNKQQSNYEQAFDLTNRSFPPINATVTKDELNEIKKSSLKKDPATTYETPTYNPANGQHQFSQNSKKQQQYNNYQRQQQQEFNLPFGKYQQQNYHQQQNGGTVNFVFNNSNNPKFTNYNTESSSQQQVTQTSSQHPRGEKPYNKGESSYFNKRHQPSQHTLSSFLNLTDKSKLDSSKPSTATTKTSVPQNETAIEQLSQQTDNLQLNVDPSQQQQMQQQQLTVYMNPSAYNPVEFNTSPKAARFFVIKSYSEDDIHRSIKYNIWCSTEHGNRRLDSAYFKGDGQVPVYLFFSVNGSGHFCGMAEMHSRVDYNRKTGVWTQEKWRGCFHVKWIYVKDVPNSLLRNIKLENNDNKPVTNSRDTQEIPYEKGRQVLKVFHTYNHSSSILDDFEHYERKQEEDKSSIVLSIPLKDEEPSNNPTKSKSELNNINQESQGSDTKQPIESTITTTTTTTSNISVTSSPSTASSTSSIDESKEPSQQEVAPQQIQEVKAVSST